MKPLSVLYADDHLIAVDKPPGWLSHASVDRGRLDVFGALREQLGLAAGELSLAHRLDRDTSGVLLFSRRPESHELTARLFRERQMIKIYWGVTAGKPRRTEWVTENFLAEEKTPASKTPRTLAVHSGGQKAITEFRVLASERGLTLIEARPLTGRRHQIRTHLREVRCPLVGDTLYGGAAGARTLLHAARLEFEHPISGTQVKIEAPLPPDFPFGLSEGMP